MKYAVSELHLRPFKLESRGEGGGQAKKMYRKRKVDFRSSCLILPKLNPVTPSQFDIAFLLLNHLGVNLYGMVLVCQS